MKIRLIARDKRNARKIYAVIMLVGGLACITTPLHATEKGEGSSEQSPKIKEKNVERNVGNNKSSISDNENKQDQKKTPPQSPALEDNEQYGMWSVVKQKSIQGENLRLQSALGESQKSLKMLTDEKNAQGEQLKDIQNKLNELQEKVAKDAEPPKSDIDRKSYVAGMSLASGIRSRLDAWEAAGVQVNKVKIISGLIDGLDGNNKLTRSDEDAIWRSFSADVQGKISSRVSEGLDLIKKKLGKKAADLEASGLSYRVVKKGKEWASPPELLHLTLSERVVDGKTITQGYHVSISPEDDMPAVIRSALPLLNDGSDVVAYGLAKTVYGELPLPAGVYPFSVMEYHLKSVKENTE